MESDLHLSPDRLALLEDCGRALRDAAELAAIVDITLSAVVPQLADMAVLVIDIDGDGPCVEASHVRAGAAAALARDVREAMDAVVRSARASADEGRYARWLPTINPDAARSVTRGDARLGALLEKLELGSLIVVALRSGGRTLGGLALGRSETPVPFTSADYAADQVLARRSALAHRKVGAVASRLRSRRGEYV